MNLWDIINTFLARPPEFENLEKYIEIEEERSVDSRRDAAIAVAVSSATFGALAGAGIWWWLRSPLLAAAALVGGMAVGGSWLYRYGSKLTLEQREFTKARGEAKAFLEELAHWRKRRQLKSKLGLACGEMLNSAALFWLRAHAALASDSWDGLSAGSHWLQMQERMQVVMDSGMAKVLLLARDARMTAEVFSPQFESMKSVVEQMRELAKEAERLSDKVAAEQAVSRVGPSDELRETLADIKRLEAAERELGEVRRVGRD